MFEVIKFATRAAVADRKGITALEYALIAAAVVTVVIVAYNSMFGRLRDFMSTISFGS